MRLRSAELPAQGRNKEERLTEERCPDAGHRPIPLHFVDFCVSAFPDGMVVLPDGMVITLWRVMSPS